MQATCLNDKLQQLWALFPQPDGKWSLLRGKAAKATEESGLAFFLRVKFSESTLCRSFCLCCISLDLHVNLTRWIVSSVPLLLVQNFAFE